MVKATFRVERVMVALIDVERHCLIVEAGTDLLGTDRQSAFGAWALLSEHPAMVVVEDTIDDARFREDALVTGPPGIRFYAGTPLVSSEGAVLGVLAIADLQPRQFAEEQLAVLANFAGLCARKLELSKPEQRQEAPEAGRGDEHGHSMAAAPEAVILCNLATDVWVLQWANSSFSSLTGIPLEAAIGGDIWSLFRVVGEQEEVLSDCNAAIFCKQSFDVTVERSEGGVAAAAAAATAGSSISLSGVQLVMSFRPAGHLTRCSGMSLAGMPSLISSITSSGEQQNDSASEDLFFATLAPVGQLSLPAGGASASRPQSAAPSFSMSPNSMRSVSFSVKVGQAYKARLFDQVTLGPLLGAGAFGRVYRGLWRGTEVAVKVMDYYCSPTDINFELSSDKHSALLEALLGRDFTRHPCLVQTFDWALKPLDPVDPHNPSAPTRHALWVVLQLCNRGSLYDAVLKGRLRQSPAVLDSPPNMLSILLTAQEIAGAMTMLHDAGIIHGDLSANYVLLTAGANSRRFTVAVSDFGRSRMCTDTSCKQTETVGTVVVGVMWDTRLPFGPARCGVVQSCVQAW